MGRPLRIEYPGAFYHVTARGNEQKDVFKSQCEIVKLGTAVKLGTDFFCSLTLEDTVEFFNLILQTGLNEQKKKDLVAFMRVL